MSWQATKWVRQYVRGVSIGARALAYHLSEPAHADGGGIKLSAETMAVELQVSKRTIEYWIAELKAAGVLKLTAGGMGRGHVAVWRIPINETPQRGTRTSPFSTPNRTVKAASNVGLFDRKGRKQLQERPQATAKPGFVSDYMNHKNHLSLVSRKFLSDSMREFAVAKGLDADHEFEVWVNHLPNNGGWPSYPEDAWREWCLKGQKYQQQRTQKGARGAPTMAPVQRPATVEEYYREKQKS